MAATRRAANQSYEQAVPSRRSVSDVVVNGVRLRVEEAGSGDETLVLSHGMLRDRRMFDAQVAVLSERYRCVRYDHRGQGESETPRDTVIEIETVYDDAVALIETLDIGPCHWIGLSMGGFVGMRLAARRPDLLRSVVLLETSGEHGNPFRTSVELRVGLVVEQILGPSLTSRLFLEPTMRSLYGTTFRHDASRRDDYKAERADVQKKLRATSPAVVRGVIKRPAVLDELPRIHVPTLVIVGAEDTPIPPRMAERLAAAIPQARFEVVPGAGHSSSVEQPAKVTTLISDFLEQLSHQ